MHGDVGYSTAACSSSFYKNVSIGFCSSGPQLSKVLKHLPNFKHVSTLLTSGPNEYWDFWIQNAVTAIVCVCCLMQSDLQYRGRVGTVPPTAFTSSHTTMGNEFSYGNRQERQPAMPLKHFYSHWKLLFTPCFDSFLTAANTIDDDLCQAPSSCNFTMQHWCLWQAF